MWRFFCPLGINLTGTRIGTIVVSRSHHHARPARWCRARDRARGVRAPALRGDRHPRLGCTSRAGRPRRGIPRRDRSRCAGDAKATTREAPRVRRRLRRVRCGRVRDSRRACVSAGADAREARQGRAPRGGHRPRRVRRGRGGVRVRFPRALAPLRDARRPRPGDVLAVPGALRPGHGLGRGARPDPAGRRPGRARSERGAQGAVRGGSRARRGRVLARRVQRHGRPVVESAGGCGGGRGRRRQRQWRHHSYRSEGRTRRRVRVRAVRGRGAREEGGGAETAVRGDRRPPPSRRGDLRGGARSGDDAKPFKSRLSKDRRRRRRRRRRRDERRRRPSVRFAEEVRGPPSGIRGGHARRRARRGVRLGPRRRPRRRRRRLRAAVPLGVERRHRAGRRVREGSLRRAHGRLYRRRLYRRSLRRERSRDHRRRASRALRGASGVRPGRLRGGGGSGAARVAGGGGGETATRTKTRRTKTKKRTPRSRRVSGTTPSRSARTSRACASPSPPRGAPLPRAGSTRRRGWRSRTCWPRRATPRPPSTSTPRRCTICPTTARSPQPRRRAPARRRRRRRTAWRGSAAP